MQNKLKIGQAGICRRRCLCCIRKLSGCPGGVLTSVAVEERRRRGKCCYGKRCYGAVSVIVVLVRFVRKQTVSYWLPLCGWWCWAGVVIAYVLPSFFSYLLLFLYGTASFACCECCPLRHWSPSLCFSASSSSSSSISLNSFSFYLDVLRFFCLPLLWIAFIACVWLAVAARVFLGSHTAVVSFSGHFWGVHIHIVPAFIVPDLEYRKRCVSDSK